ncbi:MAG: hypothetical protein ACYDCK_08120 [Thermoplasmatota archaeon]
MVRVVHERVQPGPVEPDLPFPGDPSPAPQPMPQEPDDDEE